MIQANLNIKMSKNCIRRNRNNEGKFFIIIQL